MTSIRSCILVLVASIFVAAGLSAQTSQDRLQKALREQDWKQVESIARKDLRSNPKDLDRLTLLAMALMRQGRFEAALTQSTKLIGQFPQSYAPHMIAAECQMRMRQPDKAIRLFMAAKAIAPDSVEPTMALGMLLSEIGKCDDAITHLEESLFRRPGNVVITTQLTRCYLRLGRISEASELAMRSAEIDPGDVNLQLMAGETLMAAGRTEEAIPFLQQSIAGGRGTASAHLLLTVALQDRGRTAEATDVARSYVKLAPEDAQGWFNVGLLQIEASKLDSALKSLRRAVTLKPNYPEAYYNLGRVYDGLGFSEDAVQSYRRCAATGGNLAAQSYLGIALIYRKAGNFPEALKAHNQSVSLSDTSQVCRAQRLRTCFDADRCAESASFIDDDVNRFQHSPSVLFEAARCLARNGRRFDAEKIIGVIERTSPAIAYELRMFMSM